MWHFHLGYIKVFPKIKTFCKLFALVIIQEVKCNQDLPNKRQYFVVAAGTYVQFCESLSFDLQAQISSYRPMLKLNMVKSKFHLIQNCCQIFATFSSFYV